MNLELLSSLLSSTLDPDINIRFQSEGHLKLLQTSSELYFGCIQLCYGSVHPSTQQAAALYLKNLILNKRGAKVLEGQVRDHFKQELLRSVTLATARITPILTTILSTFIIQDFPDNWPELIPLTLQFIKDPYPKQIHCGVLYLVEIVRFYSNKPLGSEIATNQLQQLVEGFFPQLLNIASNLIHETHPEAGEILWKIFKVFKLATAVQLVEYLQQEDRNSEWVKLFLEAIKIQDRSTSWQKCVKWAFNCLNRLFIRYNPSEDSLSVTLDDRYRNYRLYFISKCSGTIAEEYVLLLQQYLSGEVVLTSSNLHFIMVYLQHCDSFELTRPILLRNVDPILSTIFQMTKLSVDDLEEYESEPEQYLLSHLDDEDDEAFNPALALLKTLCQNHPEKLLDTITYLNNALTGKSLLDKEAVLHSMCVLAPSIKISAYVQHIPGFINDFIVPSLRDLENTESLNSLYKARCLDFFAKFDDSVPDDILSLEYNMVTSFLDDSLYVQVYAMLALRQLALSPVIAAKMSSVMPNIMQKLLHLYGKIDGDVLSPVVEGFVSDFSDQLLPFSLGLTQELSHQFLALLQDITDGKAQDTDYLDDKRAAAVGVLNSLTTLLLTLEPYPDKIDELLPILTGIISSVISESHFEFYLEVFDLMDSCIYSFKRVPEEFWTILQLTCKNLDNDYIDEILSCINNIIKYGGESLKGNNVGNIYKIIWQSLQPIESNNSAALNTLQLLYMTCEPGTADDTIQSTLSYCVNHAQYHGTWQWAFNVILSCLYYNCKQGLIFLEQMLWLNPIIKYWQAEVEQMSEPKGENAVDVHVFPQHLPSFSQKLRIIVLSHIVLLDGSIPEPIATNWRIIFNMLLQSLRNYQTSLTQSQHESQFSGFVDESKFSQGDFETENPLLESSLDPIDPLHLYHQTVEQLQLRYPDRLAVLEDLSPDVH